MAFINYYRISDPLDVRDLSAQMAAWTAAGNPKAGEWLPVPTKPSSDAVWTADATWVVPPSPTHTPEAWVAQHLSPLQVAALSEFRMALLQAGKPLGANMTALKGWLEAMMAESVDPTARTFPAPPCSYEDAASEAVSALQS